MWVRILSGNLAGKLRQVPGTEGQNLTATGFAREATAAEYTLFDSDSAKPLPEAEISAFERMKSEESKQAQALAAKARAVPGTVAATDPAPAAQPQPAAAASAPAPEAPKAAQPVKAQANKGSVFGKRK